MIKVLFTFMHVADEATYSVLDTHSFPANWEHNLCTSNNMLYQRVNFVKKSFSIRIKSISHKLKMHQNNSSNCNIFIFSNVFIINEGSDERLSPNLFIFSRTCTRRTTIRVN